PSDLKRGLITYRAKSRPAAGPYNPGPTLPMDALLTIPREATPAVVFLRSEIPAEHPSSAILGQERLGAGVAIAPDRILTAHYLVMGARKLEVTGFDGRGRE